MAENTRGQFFQYKFLLKYWLRALAFFCKNIVTSNFWYDKKSALYVLYRRRNRIVRLDIRPKNIKEKLGEVTVDIDLIQWKK